VLLLDEPTTGLDPGARRDLWHYLKLLRDQEQVSILVTTHLMEEAERCDRLAILSHGNLVGLGTPAELKAEIGGDVVQLEARDSDAATALSTRIAERFGAKTQVFENQVRLEREQGHRFIPEVMESFPGEILSVSVSRPSLEDVFIARTGHRFWTESEEAAAVARERAAGKEKKR
jgi:ABC-2 type transport system ATP-binding protein